MIDGVLTDISAAVDKETDRAREMHGKLYHSPHEAWGVLLEEWHEAIVEINGVADALDMIPKGITKPGKELLDAFSCIYGRALLAASELAQVAAVCVKAVDTLRSGGVKDGCDHLRRH